MEHKIDYSSKFDWNINAFCDNSQTSSPSGQIFFFSETYSDHEKNTPLSTLFPCDDENVNILNENTIIVDTSDINPSLGLMEQVKEYPPFTWEKAFKNATPAIKNLDRILNMPCKKPYYPLNNEIFAPFRLCALSNVKVIIMGQDPYPRILPSGKTEAMGMSFSGRKGEAIPSSLNNIFKELKRSDDTFNLPRDGYLGGWAKQGVLLINSRYTFHVNDTSKSTISPWDAFNNIICEAVLEENPDVIVVAWGAKALKTSLLLFPKKDILTSGHPSNLNTSVNKFIGNNHFIIINKMLTDQGKTSIDWNLTS